MISSPGIGSGLDVNTIVDQLLQIERLPIFQLEARRAENDIKISALGQLSADLSTLQSSVNTLASASSFSEFTATSSNTAVFTATATTGAAVAEYDINITNLAVAHRLNSAAFTDENTDVGTGTLTISTGTDSFAVTIDTNNDTVAQIRDAINSASDNTGVTASIVTADDGARLIFTADKSGTANKIEIIVSNDGDGNNTDNAGLSRLLYEDGGSNNRLVQLDAAENATLTIDGFAVTSSSNSITTAITGVTVNLLSESTGTLNISASYNTVRSVLSSMAERYNTLMDNIGILRDGSLSNESFLISLESQLSNVFANQYTGLGGNLTSVFDIGLSFDKEGVLTFDSSKFDTAIAADADAVAELFTQATTGFGPGMNAVIDRYLGTTGIIQGKTDAVNTNSTFLDERITSLNDRLIRTEERLLRQFTALDGLVAQLNATSTFLDQQLNLLNANSQDG